MRKNRDDQMNVLELAEQAKKRNIIDMAVGFAGMLPLFQERSGDLIKEKLRETFEGLERVGLDEEFKKMHRGFCQWFTKNIKLVKTEEPSSYGHAAKVLDLALKVYVYCCKMVSPPHYSWTIKMINEEDCDLLQKALRQEIKDSFDDRISPVQ